MIRLIIVCIVMTKGLLAQTHQLYLADGSIVMVAQPHKEADMLVATFLGQVIKFPLAQISAIKTRVADQLVDVSLDSIATKLEEKKPLPRAEWNGRTDFSVQAWDGNKRLREADLAVRAELVRPEGGLVVESLGSYDRPETGLSDRSGFLRTRYDFNRTGKRFNFYLARLGFSEFVGIKNSQTLGYGLGWILRDENSIYSRVSVGLTANRENRTVSDDVNLSSVLNLEHKRPLFGKSRLELDLNMYPNLEELSDTFKADGSISLLFPVSKAVDWKLSLYGRYNEAVLPSEEKLDTRLTSSVSLKF